MSFRAVGVIWGIRELTAELVCLLFWSLFLVPTLWGPLWGTLLCSLPCYGTHNQRHENHLHVDCPGVGQVASVRGLPGSRAGCTGLTNRPSMGLEDDFVPVYTKKSSARCKNQVRYTILSKTRVSQGFFSDIAWRRVFARKLPVKRHFMRYPIP